MKPWNALIEAEDRLRRLERAAGSNDANLKRYIREVDKSLGAREAVKRLVLDYKILPGAEIITDFDEADDGWLPDMVKSAPKIKWIRSQLYPREAYARNMYAWCIGGIQVVWHGSHSDFVWVHGISEENRSDARESLLKNTALIKQAATQLVEEEFSRPIEAIVHHLPDVVAERYLPAFYQGKENDGWVRYI